MPADPSPLTPELWARLRRLDRRCSISFYRSTPYADRWKPGRTWQVQLHDEQGMAWDTVHAEHPTLAEALRAGVDEAERRGWNKPKVEPPRSPSPP